MTRPVVGWWKGILTKDDNKTFDPTYACIIFITFAVLPLSTGALIAISFVDVYLNKHEFGPTALGGGIAAIIVAIGGFLTAAAAFINYDRKPRAPSVVVTTAKSEETKTIT